MANFKEAQEKTMEFEGGYVNDSADRGGETYRGISRKNWPRWDGWSIVDKVKRENPKTFKKVLNSMMKDEALNALVEDFYKEHFWDVFRGDYITSQKLANVIYDCAVNSGITRPIKWLQASLNDIVNSKLSVDGKYGNNTHNIVLMALQTPENEVLLVKDINRQRRNFYNDIVRRNPSQKKFLKGWLRRVEGFE